MHKSSHNGPKDYVYHNIRDATLSGIVRSETPVPVSVFWLGLSRTRAARPQQHLLEAMSSLHYSAVLSDLGCEPGMFRDRNVWQWNNDTFDAY